MYALHRAWLETTIATQVLNPEPKGKFCWYAVSNASTISCLQSSVRADYTESSKYIFVFVQLSTFYFVLASSASILWPRCMNQKRSMLPTSETGSFSTQDQGSTDLMRVPSSKSLGLEIITNIDKNWNIYCLKNPILAPDVLLGADWPAS